MKLGSKDLNQVMMSAAHHKGADLFLKGGQTKKQAGGRGTSRYSIGIKS